MLFKKFWRFMTRYLGDLLTMDASPPASYWGQVVTAKSLTMVYGPRGGGKTFWADSLAISVAAGKSFLGRTCPQPRKVLKVDGEMGDEASVRRWRKMLTEQDYSTLMGDSLGYWSYQDCKGGVIWNISDPARQKDYDQMFAEFDLIILDNLLTLSRPLNARDDDLAQWNRIQPWLIRLRDQGKAIVLIHHSGKSGDQLGSIAKETVMDNSIRLQPIPEKALTFDMTFRKARHLTTEDSQSLRCEGVTSELGIHWLFWTLTEIRDQDARRLITLGVPKTSVASRLSMSIERVYELSKETIQTTEKSDEPIKLF